MILTTHSFFCPRVSNWLDFSALFLIWCLLVPVGCSSTSEQALSRPADDAVATKTNSSPSPEASNAVRLEALWTARREKQPETDYPIGPGDVLLISAQKVDELNNRVVRVSGDGTINLPLIGVVRVSGLRADSVSAAIEDGLKKYLYNPQVQIFVQEFHSRRVAVIGAARTPGVLALTDPNETILDIITRSGGTTPDAGDEVLLFPTEDNGVHGTGAVHQVSVGSQFAADSMVFGTSELPQAVGSSEPPQAGGVDHDLQRFLSQIPADSHPIVISLKSRSLTGGQYLNLPVRPGDVMLIPGGGDVMVVGWVQTPGHFKVGSGLTVLGAIGAAGGPMYAANLSDVDLVRTDPSDHKQVISIDVNAIQKGDAPDPKVIANDVINVPYSTVKIGPYVFYNILTRMGIGGLALPVP